ncbi:hypothetical protein [Mycolicibacterium chubuense]|uniref:hypothetical protein n=1 Tax=Mycolicibacterium chubuense TaxID=1800 RepID=UPI001F1FFE67|nr:hypothetical protein [Mycolicibacterium chubuense]
MSADESDLIRAIFTSAGVRGAKALLRDLDGALVSNETHWILDVKTPNSAAAAPFPDGPFPARTFVSNESHYRGEIIIWLSDGHVSGLEFAWVTDQPPSRWPRPDEIEVHTGDVT